MKNAGHRIALAILIPLSGVWTSAAGQDYTVTNLTAGLADAPQSWATDVNSTGQVTGTFLTDGFKRTHGFVWADGQIVETIIAQPTTSGVTPVTGPDAFRHVSAHAINDAGFVAGSVYHRSFGILQYGFFTPNPSPTAFPRLQTSASGLNHWWTKDLTDTTPMLSVGQGVIIGGAPFIAKRAYAKTLTAADGWMTPPDTRLIPPLGAPHHWSLANAANENWVVVGWAEDNTDYMRAFSWDWTTGATTDLGSLGGPASEARDVNDAGHVVGHADVSLGVRHAFLHTNGVMSDLGTLGGASSEAWGVNECDQVVGWSWTGQGRVHAFLFDNGPMIDLNDQIPAGSGWVLQYAAAINDDGWIVGWGRFGGQTRAFLLVPAGSVPGDLNCDGLVDVVDVTPFVLALTDPAGYSAAFPNCDINAADLNGDGDRNGADIGAFVALLVG